MSYLSGVEYESIVTSTATVRHSDIISANFQFSFHQVVNLCSLSLIQTTITVQEGVLLLAEQNPQGIKAFRSFFRYVINMLIPL